MSEIKALEELREKFERDTSKAKLYPTAPIKHAFAEGATIEGYRALADKIEAEIAERFMELPQGWTGEQASDILAYWPTWDDGSPCMFGDEFTCYPKYDGEKKYETLDRLSIFGPNHVWRRGCDNESPHDGGYYEWNYMRPGGDDCEGYRPTKRKPRTLESILCDALADVSCMGDGIVRTFEADEPYVACLAAEIRELLGVGE